MKRKVSIRRSALVGCVCVLSSIPLALLGVSSAGATKTPHSYLAGYTSSLATGSVRAVFQVPNYTCKPADNITAGVAVYNNATSSWSQAGIFLACARHDVPEINVGFNIDGTWSYPSPFTIAIGDLVQVSIVCDTPGIVATLKNVTSGHQVQASTGVPSNCAESEIGMAGVQKANGVTSNATLPESTKQDNLPQFGSFLFQQALVNNNALGQMGQVFPGNYYEGQKNQIDTGLIGTDGEFLETQVS
jgi:hypothetical protein